MFLSLALENIVWQETVVSRPLRVSIHGGKAVNQLLQRMK
jgi:hypothetical protein